MIFDALTLAACVAEMRPALVGLIVHQVHQPDALSVSLACRGRSREARLFLSADARYGRAHLSSIRHPAPPSPPGFCQLLRKHLKGKRVQEVRQAGFDRVLAVDFVSHESEAVSLVHEIMGRHSNIILLDATNTVLGAAKVIGVSKSRVRQILSGQPYQPPPAPKLDPSQVDPAEFDRLCAASDEPRRDRWLMSAFSGIGPVLASEIAFRAGSGDSAALYGSLRQVLEIRERKAFRPVLVRDAASGREEVYPIPLLHLPQASQHPRPVVCEALEAAVGAEIARERLETTRAEMTRLIGRAMERLNRELSELIEVLANPGLAEDIRQCGQILAASFRSIASGEPQVVLPDLFDPEMKPRAIELDPRISAQSNIERYFRLARKADERANAARRRLPAISASIERLQQAAQEARSAETLDALQNLRAGLQTARLIWSGAHEAQQRPEARPFGGYRIRSVTCADGTEILVGETAEANDYLTTRIARPNDIWMHARGVNGAHVVLRTTGSKTHSSAALREAARIAADHSDAKHSSYVPVDWTMRKYVRKPRKSAPGLVTYSHEKTIHVTR